jgi:hypothetical protein
MTEITQVKLSVITKNPYHVDDQEFTTIADAIRFLSAYQLFMSSNYTEYPVRYKND